MYERCSFVPALSVYAIKHKVALFGVALRSMSVQVCKLQSQRGLASLTDPRGVNRIECHVKAAVRSSGISYGMVVVLLEFPAG